jgi:hypothetical protein
MASAGKRPLGRPRRIWEENIRMDLKEMGITTRNCVDSAQDRHYKLHLLSTRGTVTGDKSIASVPILAGTKNCDMPSEYYANGNSF